MRRNRERQWRTWRAALAGVLVAGLAACGGTDSRQDVAEEEARREVTVETASRTAVVDSAPTEDRTVAGPVGPVSFEDAEGVFREGDYQRAADLFEAYELRRPDNPWGPYMLGISAWRAGDHVRAEEALKRTLELDGSHKKGRINLARVLLELGEPTEGLEQAEILVELEPRWGEAWRVLGNARSSLGRVESAIDAYREALVLDPLDAWTMNNLGLLLIRAGHYEEALRPLARATHLRPQVAVFRNNLGIALERSGYLSEAADAFRAALEAEPEHPKATVSLERVESREPGQPQETVDLAELSRQFEEEIARWTERQESDLAVDTTASEPLSEEPVEPSEPEEPVRGEEPEPAESSEGASQADDGSSRSRGD